MVILLITAGLTASGRFRRDADGREAVRSESGLRRWRAAVRAAWRCGVPRSTLLLTHPLGVGTGDVTDELQKVYERDGIDYAQDRRLNPHNQWLQAGVAFGWPGILMVFSLILWSWFGGAGEGVRM